MQQFGKRLKELRDEKGMSQKKLADIFNVAQRTVFAWENDKQEPNIKTILNLAKFFEVTTDYLLGAED